MSDIRGLRLAIQAKLEERRDLLKRNTQLGNQVDRERERNKFLTRTLGNPMVQKELEDCADEIVNEILDRAIKASETVAEQTVENGDYEIGISIPSLHIRRRLMRMDVNRVTEHLMSRSTTRIEL